MTTRPCRLLFVITLAASVLGSGRAQGKVIDDGPHHRNELSTIRDALKRSGTHPLHILYVHGIGATGAGDSHMFLTGICPLLQGCDQQGPRAAVRVAHRPTYCPRACVLAPRP